MYSLTSQDLFVDVVLISFGYKAIPRISNFPSKCSRGWECICWKILVDYWVDTTNSKTLIILI